MSKAFKRLARFKTNCNQSRGGEKRATVCDVFKRFGRDFWYLCSCHRREMLKCDPKVQTSPVLFDFPHQLDPVFGKGVRRQETQRERKNNDEKEGEC